MEAHSINHNAAIPEQKKSVFVEQVYSLESFVVDAQWNREIIKE